MEGYFEKATLVAVMLVEDYNQHLDAELRQLDQR
jgi:hypothetical protein